MVSSNVTNISSKCDIKAFYLSWWIRCVCIKPHSHLSELYLQEVDRVELKVSKAHSSQMWPVLQGSKKASLGWQTLSVKIILYEDCCIHSFEYHLWLLSHAVQQSWMAWRSLPSAGKLITRCFTGKCVERLSRCDYSTVCTQRNKRGHHGWWEGQSNHSVGRVPALKTQNLSLIPLYKKMPAAVGGTYLLRRETGGSLGLTKQPE